MKKEITFLVILLTIFVSSNLFSQMQYGLSEALVEETGAGKNVTFTDPYTNNSREVFAGLMEGEVDDHNTLFYCIDIRRTLNFPDHCHRDSAVANPKIVYILNNYYPYNPDPVGELSNLNNEVAATQCAIWHFSDGVNLNTITSSTIRDRALEIKADADANGTFTDVFTTIQILPSVDPDYFYIKTTDQDGNGIAVNNITLSIAPSGSLNPTSVNTNASGISPDVQVIGTTTGVITATGDVIIPQGITYTCTGKQRLVIAKPCIGERRTTADWGALPVELTSFTSTVSGRNVTLKWTTASELNNSGFDIERKLSGTESWTVVGNVAGNGTSTVSQNYSFTDRNVASGVYNYRMKQIDYNGNFEYFNLSSEVQIGVPAAFELNQNYPNPFNPSTKISFGLPKDGNVTLKIYDFLGKEVATLVNEYKNAGYYTVDFNASNLTSGVYFYKMESNGQFKVMKMSLVK